MTIEEMAQIIPNDNPNKEIILMLKLLSDIENLKRELRIIVASMKKSHCDNCHIEYEAK